MTSNQVDALLDGLRQALEANTGPDDAMTIPEIAAVLARESGRSVEMTRRRLRELLPILKARGIVELVWLRRLAVDDRMAKVPGYRFTGLAPGRAGM